MALSMDEQRMLAEIERRLTAEDPGLAARLSSFKRSGPSARIRSPRNLIIGSVFAVAAALVLSVMVYAMIPYRTHAPRNVITPQATGKVSVSAPAKPGPGTAGNTANAKPAANTGNAGNPAHRATSRATAG
jgi:hypothetical protein